MLKQSELIEWTTPISHPAFSKIKEDYWKLQAEYDDVIELSVVGGALRDCIYNKNIKDIDFAIKYIGPIAEEPAEHWNWSFYIDRHVPDSLSARRSNVENAESSAGQRTFNSLFFTGEKFANDQYKYDILYSKFACHDLIQLFDFSFNSVYLKDNKVFVHPKFMETYHTKKVSLFPDIMHDPKQLFERTAYFVNKFPEFDFSAVYPKAKPETKAQKSKKSAYYQAKYTTKIV